MAITVNDAILLLRVNIVDPSRTNGRYTEAEVLAQLNSAKNTVARELKYPTRLSSLTSVLNQQEYDVATGIIEINSPVTYDDIFLTFLEFSEVKKLESPLNPLSNVKLYQTPEYYYIRGESGTLKIGFYPIPDEAGKTIKYFNSYIPAAFTAVDNMPYSNDDFNDLIVLLASVKLLKPDYIGKDLSFERMYLDKLVGCRLDIKAMQGVDYVDYDEEN